ncbi:MAG TPA: serpin family protein [Actinomycetota bacterium]|nr:serpin family protein [Actinomycetota bacterium]
MVVLATCSGPTDPDPDPITELPRPLTAAEQAVISASNTFGLDLIGRVAAADDRPNVVLSPLSASMALGMALNGAGGTTFDSMRHALGFDGLSQEEINDSYRELLDLLTGLDAAVRFEIANAIWAREGVPFHQAFFDAVTAAFDATAESRDFADPETVEALTAWVHARTGGLIDSIVEEIDPALVMLLVNAIYFDGEWTHRFDPADTHAQPFTLEDGSSVQAPMMTMDAVEVNRGYGADYAAVELPYGGGAFSMVIVLPRGQTSAREWLTALDAEAWAALVGGLAPGKLDLLAVPKYTLSFDAFLNDGLRAMGMDVAFTDAADFTRLSPIGDGMCIDFVRQKTFIEVDERGTRAAAVTAVGVGLVSFSAFVADRPFVLAIRERLSGTVLFMGLVTDPTAEVGSPAPPPSRDDC